MPLATALPEKTFKIIWMMAVNNATFLALLTPTQLDDLVVQALASDDIYQALVKLLKDKGVLV